MSTALRPLAPPRAVAPDERAGPREATDGGPRPYADPWLTGVGLGVLLALTFVVVGRGLGAIGGFASAAAAGVRALLPGWAHASAYWAPWAEGPTPLLDWLVLELAGAMVGALLSARAARRLQWSTERGPRLRAGARLAVAFAGGAVMGFGARLARGCTSGLVLSGGAVLAASGWVFAGAAFAAAFALAPALRRLWT